MRGLFYDYRAKKILQELVQPTFKFKTKSAYIRFFFQFNKKQKELRKLAKHRYVYRLDVMPEVAVKKISKIRFLSIRLTRLYFITFKDYQFRAMFRRAAKAQGNMEDNYVTMLEGRLLNLVYRTLFVETPFVALRYIRNSAIYINFVNIHSIIYMLLLVNLFMCLLLF